MLMVYSKQAFTKTKKATTHFLNNSVRYDLDG